MESATSAAGVRVTSGFPAAGAQHATLLASAPPALRRPHQIESFIMCCPLGTPLKAINSFHSASLWTIKAF